MPRLPIQDYEPRPLPERGLEGAAVCHPNVSFKVGVPIFRSMPAMSYWDVAEQLHTRYAKEFPETEAAVGAIRRIRRVLGPFWKPQGFHEHPWSMFIMVAPRPRELTHLALKLETLERIPGHEKILPRLGSPDTFPAAWHEADFALKLSLNGFWCRFVPETKDPRWDLEAEIGGEIYEVEVTSLNPPLEDQLSATLSSAVFTVMVQYHVAVGGVAFISSDRATGHALSQFTEGLVTAAKRARAEATCIRVNEPGLATFQVAAPEAVHRMDPKWKGAWTLEYRPPLPKDRKLSQTIAEKAGRQFSRTRPALLAVYDRLLTDEEEEQLAANDFSVQVGTYDFLKAVTLIRTLTRTDPFATELRTEGTLTRGRHSLPDREAEAFIVWRNMMDPKSIDTVVPSLTDFPRNLSRLYGEDSASNPSP